MEENGKGKATASMVLGIISVVLLATGYGSIFSVILSIVGLILAASSKKDGYEGSQRTAGMVMNLISVIVGAVVFVSCISCFGLTFLAALSEGYY